MIYCRQRRDRRRVFKINTSLVQYKDTWPPMVKSGKTSMFLKIDY